MHRRSGLSTALALLCVSVLLRFASPVVAEPLEPRFHDIEYATSAEGQPLLLDLYLPPASLHAPLLVWVHGGAWEFGSKSPMPIAVAV